MVSCSFIHWRAPNLRWSIGKLIVHIIPLALICSHQILLPTVSLYYFRVILCKKKSGRVLQFSFVLDSLFTQAWWSNMRFHFLLECLWYLWLDPFDKKKKKKTNGSTEEPFFNYVLSHKDDLTSHSYDIETITISHGGLTNSSTLHSCCCYFLPVTYKLVCMIKQLSLSHTEEWLNHPCDDIATVAISYGRLPFSPCNTCAFVSLTDDINHMT